MPSIPLSALPLCSSTRLITALEALGAYQEGRHRGSHVAYHRDLDGRIVTAAVALNKKEIPRPTLKSILVALEIELAEFLDEL